MKINFILPNLSNGGVTRTVTSIALGLADKGHEVEVILLYGVAEGSNMRSDLAYRKLFPFDINLPILLLLLPVCLLRFHFLVKNNTKMTSWISSHGLISNLFVCMYKIIFGRSFFFSGFEHNTPSYVYKGFAGALKKFCIRCLYPRLDLCIGVSGGVVRDLCDISRRIRPIAEHVYNAFDLREIAYCAQKAPPLDKDVASFFAQWKFVVAMVGRLTSQKDYSTAIRAIRSLESEAVGLVIVGDGPLLAELRREVASSRQSNVYFTGHLSNPFGLMARSHLFLLTSVWESFGNVLVEAMALGLPVVATDCPHGPSEILDDGRYGVLVPTGDTDSLRLAIFSVLTRRRVFDPDWQRSRAAEFERTRQIDRLESLMLSRSAFDRS